MAKITIFDLDNKVIGYSGTYSEGVRDVFCQWGGIYVYGANGKVSNLYIWEPRQAHICEVITIRRAIHPG